MIEAFVEMSGSITVHMSREDAQALLLGDDAQESGLLDELSAALDTIQIPPAPTGERA